MVLNDSMSSVSLLYVEDDPVTREAVGKAIAATLPAVLLLTAENGELGLEMFKEHRPDIVLTDISMPVMNGIEMARKIRALDSGAKIIAATAMSDTSYLLDAIKIGISRYVLKPIDLEMFFEAINDCIARISLERQIKRQNDLIRQLNDELEQRVQERTVELEASNRELESFCYSVAHDLSTPLRAMSCFSAILQEDHADQLCDSGKEYLGRIGSASVRMGQLINDLLNLSRVTRRSLRRERVDLSAVAHEVVKMLSDEQPGRRVEVVISEGVVAYGDHLLVKLALENMMGNAWKYTGKEPCPRIEFGSRSLQGETVYFLKDNGIGFDMAYAPRIFIPFERLHRVGEFEGTGIGLATVQRIVARHGGRVWGEGEEGKGATFFFTLGLPPHISPGTDN